MHAERPSVPDELGRLDMEATTASMRAEQLAREAEPPPFREGVYRWVSKRMRQQREMRPFARLTSFRFKWPEAPSFKLR